jgi:hypothetical protein
VSQKLCRVAFTDLAGLRHCVEVKADTLYEAAVLGLKAHQRSSWSETVGPSTRLEIEVLEPIATHLLLVGQLLRWLDGGATSPAEVIRKRKLKALLQAST